MKQILIILFVLLVNQSFAQSDWKLKKNENGIKVYTRSAENSNFAEFKAITVINSPIDKIFQLVSSCEKDKDWIDRVCYSKKIYSKGNTYISYEQSDLPIGFKDRDIVIENTVVKYPDGKIKIKMKAVPDKYPQQKGYMRIKKAYGFWLFEPLSANRTKVSYQFFSDPRGAFPAWLVNMFIVDGPFNTLSKLKKLMEK